MRTAWAVRSLVAGVAGTAVMTLAYEAERRLRHRTTSIDYDDSVVPGQIVASILDLHGVTDQEDLELGELLRWSYGSAFGIWHGVLRTVVPEPYAALLFGSTLLGATFTAFPLLGRTPPPWRWPPDVIATAVGTHAAYTLAVAVVDDALRPSRDRAGQRSEGARRRARAGASAAL
ncbi:MAG TPA: hypothetical protein VFL59_05005 [Candidatus Nanopelagicales bacterium]|nr:hypothetical protein [Candidatus Nanopelagicales bacterium]